MGNTFLIRFSNSTALFAKTKESLHNWYITSVYPGLGSNVQNAETFSIENIRDIFASISPRLWSKGALAPTLRRSNWNCGVFKCPGGICKAHHEEGCTKYYLLREGNEACHPVWAYNPASSEGTSREGEHDSPWVQTYGKRKRCFSGSSLTHRSSGS